MISARFFVPCYSPKTSKESKILRINLLRLMKMPLDFKKMFSMDVWIS
jgi:hypothetical protein